jgi:hypothetical protein
MYSGSMSAAALWPGNRDRPSAPSSAASLPLSAVKPSRRRGPGRHVDDADRPVGVAAGGNRFSLVRDENLAAVRRERHHVRQDADLDGRALQHARRIEQRDEAVVADRTVSVGDRHDAVLDRDRIRSAKLGQARQVDFPGLAERAGRRDLDDLDLVAGCIEDVEPVRRWVEGHDLGIAARRRIRTEPDQLDAVGRYRHRRGALQGSRFRQHRHATDISTGEIVGQNPSRGVVLVGVDDRGEARIAHTGEGNREVFVHLQIGVAVYADSEGPALLAVQNAAVDDDGKGRVAGEVRGVRGARSGAGHVDREVDLTLGGTEPLDREREQSGTAVALALGHHQRVGGEAHALRGYVAGDADIVDAHPFVVAGRIGGDEAHLHLRLVVHGTGQRDGDIRLLGRKARAGCGVQDLRIGRGAAARRQVGPVAGLTDPVLHRDRHDRVVGGAIQVTRLERDDDVLPSRGIEVHDQVRRVGGAGAVERDGRIGDVEFADATRSTGLIWVGQVGADVEVVCGSGVGEERTGIGSRRGGDVLPEKSLEARHARPVVVRGDQSGIAPVLGEISAGEIEVDLGHDRSASADAKRYRSRETAVSRIECLKAALERSDDLVKVVGSPTTLQDGLLWSAAEALCDAFKKRSVTTQ